MVRLFSVLAVSVVLAYLYEHTYISTTRGNKRVWLFYAALVAVLICFAGFRGSYNDTWNYREAYVTLAKGFPEAWETFSWDLGENPGFVLIQSWLKTYNTDVHLFLMFFSFWTVLFYVGFLKRYHTNFALTIYFFFTISCYLLILGAIKQCMATAFCLLAMRYAFEKKWIRFIALVLVGSLFHQFALMYLIVPLMAFRPWSKGTPILLISSVIAGFLFQPLIGTVINITTALGEGYTESTFSGAGISGIRIAVCWVPVCLSFIYRDVLFKDSSRTENIIMNLSMLYAGITFVGQFGTALYFGRLASYFVIMQVISLPWMLTKIRKVYPKDGAFITATAVICYFLFFYASNTIENDFATSYEALSLSGFLKILFDALKGGNI